MGSLLAIVGGISPTTSEIPTGTGFPAIDEFLIGDKSLTSDDFAAGGGVAHDFPKSPSQLRKLANFHWNQSVIPLI
jgi:hypothetical protein